MGMNWSPSLKGFYSDGRSDAPGDLTQISDALYAGLLAGNAAGQNIVTGVDGTPELQAIPVDLAAYANAKQWALATGGFTATVGGSPFTFATDDAGRANLTAKTLRMNMPSPPATILWQCPQGFCTVPEAAFVPLAIEIADFVQATFDALAAVLAEIVAGTITTAAQIDAAPVWPALHS